MAASYNSAGTGGKPAIMPTTDVRPGVPIVGTGGAAVLVPYLLPARLGVELPLCWLGPVIDVRGYVGLRMLVTATGFVEAAEAEAGLYVSDRAEGGFRLAESELLAGMSAHGVSWAWLPLDSTRRFVRITIASECVAMVGILLELVKGPGPGARARAEGVRV